MSTIERHHYDVVVIGAGGAGLRAAIEARLAGARTAVISKSLFGKAHTVMAEGGAAAAMGNVNPNDSWQVHFRDTMRGGKFLNNVRMAELHAREAPQRVWELETYGALFDRTRNGKISQRNFGGHEYPRLAHVGDRTGLEMIRTLQQKIVSLQQEDFGEAREPKQQLSGEAREPKQQLSGEAREPKQQLGGEASAYESRLKVFNETTITDLLLDDGAIAGAFGYDRETGTLLLFEAPAVVLATGGVGRSYQVTSNSWEYTGDGHALALRAGGRLINMEFVQFHPTGMVWPPSVKGILVTESVRGDGGVLTNSEGRRFMFDYVPEVFLSYYAETPEEADRWYEDPDNNRRPPELLPRDEVARAINTEVKAGRGSPAGGVYLDVSSRLPAETIKKKLPSMYHQFRELADVDITKQPMEVGPTCHYVMGGVEVDADTAATTGVAGLYAAGEVSGGMHGSNRLGGNSLSDLLVFGKRAGEHAAAYASSVTGRPARERPQVAKADLEAAAETVLAPLSREDGEQPYVLQHELQAVMQRLVGIIRSRGELEESLAELAKLKDRVAKVGAVGGRHYNPGWHLALDLRNMLLVSECTARAALAREESRGGHTREDFPTMDPAWRQIILVCTLTAGDEVRVEKQPVPELPKQLSDLFERDELAKYLTPEELS